MGAAKARLLLLIFVDAKFFEVFYLTYAKFFEVFCIGVDSGRCLISGKCSDRTVNSSSLSSELSLTGGTTFADLSQFGKHRFSILLTVYDTCGSTNFLLIHEPGL
jgi:hypothetical protein